MAFIVGLCAGAFGIGGGLIQGPLMLALGVGPGLLTLNSPNPPSCHVRNVSLCSLNEHDRNSYSSLRYQHPPMGLGNLVHGILILGIFLWTSATRKVRGFSAFCTHGSRLVKIYKKQSLIVFLLAFLVVVTTGALVYSFSRRITSNTATWSFKPLCAATPAPPFVNVNVTEK